MLAPAVRAAQRLREVLGGTMLPEELAELERSAHVPNTCTQARL
jgi:hypothetical protein